MALQLTALASVLATAGGRLTVPIGTLFNNKDKDLKQAISAMSFAMQEHELSNRSQEHVLKFYVDNIDTVDAYKLTKIICKQVRSRGSTKAPSYFFSFLLHHFIDKFIRTIGCSTQIQIMF